MMVMMTMMMMMMMVMTSKSYLDREYHPSSSLSLLSSARCSTDLMIKIVNIMDKMIKSKLC